MQVKVQVITLRDDGEESLQEVACVERDELTSASLGLSIADSKTILQGIQAVVVEWQMHEYLNSLQRHCPQCGKLRHRKGPTILCFARSLATCRWQVPVSLIVPVSPMRPKSSAHWLNSCPSTLRRSCSTWRPNGPPLSSYGTSVKLLQDVLPFDEPLEAVTIRNHVCTLAERLEDELGDEQVSFIEGCPRDSGVHTRIVSF